MKAITITLIINAKLDLHLIVDFMSSTEYERWGKMILIHGYDGNSVYFKSF